MNVFQRKGTLKYRLKDNRYLMLPYLLLLPLVTANISKNSLARSGYLHIQMYPT
jgi:hypothetical protein